MAPDGTEDSPREPQHAPRSSASAHGGASSCLRGAPRRPLVPRRRAPLGPESPRRPEGAPRLGEHKVT
eukprot:8406068-Pyramimonas_sp.AAC.1